MTSSKNTKRALLASVLSIALCCAMLIGSTFAWFTDSVTNTGNRIQAGNLEIDLLMDKQDGNGYVSIAGGEGDIFKEAQIAQNSNKTLWEPGKTQIVYLGVQNKGSLALKYNILLDVTDNGLVGALEYAVLDGAQARDLAGVTDWEALKAMGGAQTGDIAAGRTTAAPNGCLDEIVNGTQDETDYFALAVHMKEDAGNEYQGKDITIDVTVVATQATAEEDGFGDNQYDKDAAYADVSVSTAEDFEAALDDPEVTYITVAEDLTFDWGNASYDNSNALKMRNKVISGVTGDEVITFAGYGSANPIKDVTLNNITVKDITEGDVETAWEHGYLEFENLTANDVVFEDPIQLNGACTLTNCTFKGTSGQYAVWVNSGDITLTNCTLDGMRMLKIHEAYGSEVTSVVVDGCTFDGTLLKAGIDIGTLNAETSLTVKNCTFNGCGIYEGDTPVENFTYVAENNTEN